MDRESARQEIRARWREFYPHDRNGGIICPLCDSGGGKNGTGITEYKQKPGSLRCWNCDFQGDVIDLIQQERHIDYNNALQYAANDLHITIDPYRSGAATNFVTARKTATQSAQQWPANGQEAALNDSDGNLYPKGGNGPETANRGDTEALADYAAYYEQCRQKISDPAAIAYLQARGISEETARAAGIGYDPQADTKNNPDGTGRSLYPTPRIIFPVNNSYYTARRIDSGKDYRYTIPTGAHVAIWNAEAVYSQGAVFVCEGIFDALSIKEAGGSAIALNSTSNCRKLLDQLKQRPTTAKLIICLDNDDAGRRATETLKEGLEELNQSYTVAHIAGSENDCNDALRADRAAFTERVQAAINEPPRDVITDFLEHIQGDNYKPLPTGLGFFDRVLSGGMMRQTVLYLMAAPGTGKTTLCQQVAESLAANGIPVLYICLEMSREQMYAKSISRLTTTHAEYDKNGLTTAQVLQGYNWTPEQEKSVYKAAERYRKHILPFMQYSQGITGDLDQLQGHLTSTGDAAKARGQQAPVVFLDYLHLVSSSKGLDVKEIIKKAVEMLKGYAIKYDTAAVAISATNRDSMQSGRITINSGRDSSSIEYSADNMLSLDYTDIDNGTVDPKCSDRLAALQKAKYRDLTIRALKTRFGTTGAAEQVKADMAHNIFYGEDDFLPLSMDEQTPSFGTSQGYNVPNPTMHF